MIFLPLQIVEEIERGSAIDEAKFILGELGLETKQSYEGVATDLFYADVVLDLVETIANFE